MNAMKQSVWLKVVAEWKRDERKMCAFDDTSQYLKADTRFKMKTVRSEWLSTNTE